MTRLELRLRTELKLISAGAICQHSLADVGKRAAGASGGGGRSARRLRLAAAMLTSVGRGGAELLCPKTTELEGILSLAGPKEGVRLASCCHPLHA